MKGIKTFFRILRRAKWFFVIGFILLLAKLISPYVADAKQLWTTIRTDPKKLISDYKSNSAEENVSPTDLLPDDWVSPEPEKPDPSESSPGQLPVHPSEIAEDAPILTVSFIDVGQGDSVLLQLDGKAILVDGGNRDKGTLVQKFLLDSGVEKLDAVISTHGDADHCSGLRVICQKFPVDAFYMSYLDHDTNTYQELKRIVSDKMIPTVTPLAGDTMEFGPALITFVSPVEGETESNAASIAFILEYGSCRYLFCGDAEDLTVDGIYTDVLMAPHHGSYSGNDIEKNISYGNIVISASGIDYGHPHQSTMQLIEMTHANLYRTDKQGSIISHCDGQSVWFDQPPCTDFSPGLDLED